MLRAPTPGSTFAAVDVSNITFATYGRALGLDDDRVVDALAVAIRAAGPACGGRYVGLHHAIEEDETSRVAVAELLEIAVSRRTDAAALVDLDADCLTPFEPRSAERQFERPVASSCGGRAPFRMGNSKTYRHLLEELRTANPSLTHDRAVEILELQYAGQPWHILLDDPIIEGDPIHEQCIAALKRG